MKCTKCSYTSFDFNQTCPKCGKDLSAEGARLRLPSYKPTPPYLLTSFTGETGGFEPLTANETSGVSSFLENRDEEIFMLDDNTSDSSESLKNSSLNDGENELMVALDELSFEYEPALEMESETQESREKEDLSLPDISREEKAFSTESELFDAPITEDAAPFAPIDKEDDISGIFDKIEEPETTESPEDYLELDLSEMDQLEDQPEEDELLISLDDLSFDQEPVSSKDFHDQAPADGNGLSASEILNYDEETDHDQTESLDDHVNLDFSDMVETEGRAEDLDEISYTPGMLDAEDILTGNDMEMPDLPSDPEIQQKNDDGKGGKKKTELKNEFIDLDLLEMEVDTEGS